MRRQLLDLFCGEGGASVGYVRAGWAVTGVDCQTRVETRYRDATGGDFVADDALVFLAASYAEYIGRQLIDHLARAAA